MQVKNSPKQTEPERPAVQKTNNLDIRLNIRNTLLDALSKRKADAGTEFEELTVANLRDLCRLIEEALFDHFGKDVGFKYKSRYRSLVFNIKDVKNNGLYRRILSGDLTPKAVAAMTSDEMASKELAAWRSAAEKKDIEAIQKAEIERLKIGTPVLLKSHKGQYFSSYSVMLMTLLYCNRRLEP